MGDALRDRWVVITNSSRLRLAGELRLPAGPGPHPVVAFAHGLGSMLSQRNRVIAEALRSSGITTVLFDFTGQGDSEGAAEDCTASQQTDDLESVVDFVLASEPTSGGPLGILGANSTALAALTVAAENPDIRALVLKAGRVRGAQEVAARVTAPTQLVVGERDGRILAENEALLAHLAGPCRLAVIPGGDHLLEDGGVLGLTSARIAAWFARHLLGAELQDWLAKASKLDDLSQVTESVGV